MIDFKGKTVVITGASKGIGKATAYAFAEVGANVALLARSADALESIARDIGPTALAVTADVADAASVAAAVTQTVDTFGSVDVLINNAGMVEPIARMSDADPADWAHVININLSGVFYGMHAVLPHMIAAGGGSVLTISSGAAHGPLEGWSHYCASKAGAAMLTRCLDKENRDHGIRAIGLSPGTVATEMQVQIKSSGLNPVSQLDPSVHIPAEWPAQALVWMATSDADAYLGEEISLRDADIRAAIGLAT